MMEKRFDGSLYLCSRLLCSLKNCIFTIRRMTDLELTIRKFALQNAIQHKGTANSKAVMGKVIAEFPEIKNETAHIIARIEKIVSEINQLSVEKQKIELEKIAPELLIRKKKEKEQKLPPLPFASQIKPVMRLAPFPSGAPHIGNLRSFILNDEYTKMYNGTLYLFFDDTIGSEEKTVLPQSYDLIKDALDWLNVKYSKIYYKSDRVELYYKWGYDLINSDSAYICFCDSESLRKNRELGKECHHRNGDVNTNLDHWQKMLDGVYSEGECSVRIKTDMQHKNPAFRDRVLFRISRKEHPRVGSKYCVWPLLELSWAVDDYLLDITHILRGKDLMIEDEMERYIWNVLNQKTGLPLHDIHFIHYGMLQLEDAKISKSKAMKEVLEGTFTGWDDPRTWSLQSLRSRGFRVDAIREFILSFGVSLTDISVPVDNLYSANRTLIDKDAPRLSFISEPIRINIVGLPENLLCVKAPLHPDYPEKGYRRLTVSNEIYIEKKDFETFQAHELRLKDFCNIYLENGKAQFLSLENRNIPRIHWLNALETQNCRLKVILDDGTVIEGVAEPTLRTITLPSVVQFERFGFVNVRRRIAENRFVGFYKYLYLYITVR